MAKSARELFDEAMRLDPRERGMLLRLLIDALDDETEEGVEDAWRAEVERRMAESPGKKSEHGCTDAEWRRYPSGSTLPLRRRPFRPMTGTPPEIPTWRTHFATNCNTLSRPSRAIPTRGRVMHSQLDDTSSHGFPSASSTEFVATKPRSSRSLTPSGGQDIGDPVCDPVVRPSNFTLHQTARSRCSLAAGERAR